MGIAKTEEEILTQVEQNLEDPNNKIWTRAQLGTLKEDALVEASPYSPYLYKETVHTTADSRELDISIITNLIEVEHAEYKTGKDPLQYRGVNVYGDILTLDTTLKPSADDEDVYLFCKKVHTLVPDMDDKTGAVNNGSDYAAGATSIILDALGTGTIYKNTIVSFAGTNGQYLVSADATITTNAATIVLDHGLLEAVVDDTVVTFICSTLTPELEKWLPELIAARAKLNWLGTGRTEMVTAVNVADQAAASILDMMPQIDQHIADMTTARTEAAKITTAIGLANDEFDKEDALLLQSLDDLANSRVEASKIPDAIALAHTALAAVAARITQSIADGVSARAETDKTVALIDSANTAFGKMDNMIDNGVTALQESQGYINTVARGNDPEARLMSLSDRYNNAARGYQAEGNALMSQASADMAVSGEYRGLGMLELNEAQAKLGEAGGQLQKASANRSGAAAFAAIALNGVQIAMERRSVGFAYLREGEAHSLSSRTYQGIGSGDLQAARASLNQAIGFIRELLGRLNISRMVQNYQNNAIIGLNMVLSELKGLKGPNQRKTYPRR